MEADQKKFRYYQQHGKIHKRRIDMSSSEQLHDLLYYNNPVTLEQVKKLVEAGADPNSLGHYRETAFDLIGTNDKRIPDDVIQYLFQIKCTFNTDNGSDGYSQLLEKKFQQVKDKYKAEVDPTLRPDDKTKQRIYEKLRGPTEFQKNRSKLIQDVERLLHHLKTMKDSPSNDNHTHFTRTMEYITDADDYLKRLPRVEETDVLIDLETRGLDINSTDALEQAIGMGKADKVELILNVKGCKVGLHHLFLAAPARSHPFDYESASKKSIFKSLVNRYESNGPFATFEGLSMATYLEIFQYDELLKIWRNKFPDLK